MTQDAEKSPVFRWPVSATRTIAAPASRVWEVISSPGLLPLYHPFCKENRVHHWPGPDSHDEVHYFSGWVLERNFTDWIDGVGYDLEVGRAGGRTSTVSWRVADKGDDLSEFRISIRPYALQHLSVFSRWVPHLLVLRPQLTRYLTSVVKGLDWFITFGETVRRNQFGSHRWFSPPIQERPE